ncbi:MAG: nitrogen fixation protein FixH [Verrucomicrobiales bacterium]|nr:nitrogen fixation protein FixH [Verrucomicrobiales bacterium]
MNSQTTKAVVKSRNPWPIAIIAYFVIFASCVAGFGTWVIRQNIDLVRKDYYEEEVRFQQQMEKVNRTQPFESSIAVAYVAREGVLNVQLPQAHAIPAPAGRIDLYRPSDASLDQHIMLAVDRDGAQKIVPQKLRTGLWKVRMNWNVDGQDYFSERSIFVN